MIGKRWIVILLSILLIILGVIIGFILFSNITRAENKAVCIYFFYGETCPHCAQEKPFLNSLKSKYPQIELHSFEVYFNKENQKLWENTSKAYGAVASGVPMTFIGNKVFIGFAEGDSKIYDSGNKAYVGYSGVIEETIKEYVNTGGAECPSFQFSNSSSESTSNAGNSSSNSFFTPWEYRTTFSEIIVYVVGIIAIVAIVYILLKKFKR
jgi:thiol-disulfide isomerase/thioredoxin